ncbi:hypothetical protein KAFR_0D01910 [Kazachstania africana CBS 2517]|uniref:Uncharacterized protein n=1 Tax=Kazachstania africana (strain ATCC 22294 / BCRC 22015 / CBS 2517 / CECT 1963 / NBRC 1671 / NRRL Y-8276) TaxID=1071382 RepID=H2ATY8_KAZAF|nr:hypothetical protein KAFR_0D01910 [Kazachstania africana CBS 2517]CCF57838.1 hypothetical protein KAFR_0D01910 [Kazachstania africana CBS 2517]
MRTHNIPDYDDSNPPNEQLPSYEEALNTPAYTNTSTSFSTVSSANSVPQLPNRPRPNPPQAPSSSQSHHHRHSSKPTSSRPPAPNLPWVYPRGFHCLKCNNTGYKLKNGKSCKSCWRQFAPTNNLNPIQNYNSPFQYYQSPIFTPVNTSVPYGNNNGRPLVVRPGDPRLGGIVCGNCRGSGRIRFLLDENICPLCNGIGRILNNR